MNSKQLSNILFDNDNVLFNKQKLKQSYTRLCQKGKIPYVVYDKTDIDDLLKK